MRLDLDAFRARIDRDNPMLLLLLLLRTARSGTGARASELWIFQGGKGALCEALLLHLSFARCGLPRERVCALLLELDDKRGARGWCEEWLGAVGAGAVWGVQGAEDEAASGAEGGVFR
jgi:hypothetical protein